MGVATPTTGVVTATVAVLPEFREAYLTGAPMHQEITDNGVKPDQSDQ